MARSRSSCVCPEVPLRFAWRIDGAARRTEQHGASVHGGVRLPLRQRSCPRPPGARERDPGILHLLGELLDVSGRRDEAARLGDVVGAEDERRADLVAGAELALPSGRLPGEQVGVGGRRAGGMQLGEAHARHAEVAIGHDREPELRRGRTLATRRPLAAVESNGFGRVESGVVTCLGGCAWVGESSEQRVVGQRILVVLDLADPEEESKRCDLLLALGHALWPAGETERVIAQVAPDALLLAEKQGDRGRAFRACRLALDCLQAQGALYRPERLRWAELAHRHATPDSTERVYADLALAQAWRRPVHSSDQCWTKLRRTVLTTRPPCSNSLAFWKLRPLLVMLAIWTSTKHR